MVSRKELADSLDLLRRDALARNMWDLAFAYGMATVRVRIEIVRESVKRFCDGYGQAQGRREA